MKTPRRNDNLVDGLRNEYVRLYAPTTSWGNIPGMMLGLPGLRGYWPMSSVDEVQDARDLSGQARTLADNGTLGYGTVSLIPYVDLVRLSSQYLSRADEAGLDITKYLALGGWYYFDAPSTGNATGLMSKWNTTGNQRSYALYKDAANALSFSISSDGAAGTVMTITDSSANYAASAWFFIAGRFIASTEIAIFVNGTWYRTTEGVPVSIFSGTAEFRVGSYDQGNYLDGRASHQFLCGSGDRYVTDTVIEALFQHSRGMFGV